jgi:hypothetical protein
MVLRMEKERRSQEDVVLRHPQVGRALRRRRNLVDAARREGKSPRHMPIATCAPNKLMAKIHNRMPVILRAGARDRCFDPPARKNSVRCLFHFPPRIWTPRGLCAGQLATKRLPGMYEAGRAGTPKGEPRPETAGQLSSIARLSFTEAVLAITDCAEGPHV